MITRSASKISFHPDWHGTLSNLGTQVEAQNKDFGAVTQTKLNQSLVSSVAQASLREMAEIQASETPTV